MVQEIVQAAGDSDLRSTVQNVVGSLLLPYVKTCAFDLKQSAHWMTNRDLTLSLLFDGDLVAYTCSFK